MDILGRERVLVCGVDVTERERREHDLRSSEERLRATIEASPVAVLEVDLDDRISLWNPAAERMFGWTAEEMIGGPLRHIPDEERARLGELMTRVRAGEIYTGVEGKRLCKDGRLIDVEISAAPIRDASDTVISHLALFADISDRKRQEEELRASRARIVKAGDEARRRLERNLHDGAQQRLVALSLSLRLAQSKVEQRPAGGRRGARVRARGARRCARRAPRARSRHPSGHPHRPRPRARRSKRSPPGCRFPSRSTRPRSSCLRPSRPPRTT